MSHDVTNAVKRCARHLQHQGHGWLLKTLRELADRANDHGECFPGLPAIAEQVGITQRSARRAIAKLRDLGIVHVARQQGMAVGDHRGWRTNRYQIDLDRLRALAAQGTAFAVPRDTRADATSSHGRTSRPPMGGHDDHMGGHHVPDGRTPMSANTPENPQEPPDRARGGARGGGDRMLMQEGKRLAGEIESRLGIRCAVLWPELATAHRTYGQALLDRLERWSRQHGLVTLDDQTLREATLGTRSQYGGWDIPPLDPITGAA